MKKAIIFDLDGVLVHTDDLHFQAWKKLADSIGVYFDQDINNRLRGISRMESLEIMLEKSDKSYTPQQRQEFCKLKNDTYKKLLTFLTRGDIPENVVPTLERLKKNYLLAVGSSSQNAKPILNYTGLADLFDAVSDGVGLAKTKPDPEVFLRAAKSLKVDPQDCVVVEDAVAGVRAGKTAQMTTIAIGDAAVKKSGDYNISDFTEIIKIMENI